MRIYEKEELVFNQIKESFKKNDDISISLIQRKFLIGYNSATRIIDKLEAENIIIKNKNKFGVGKIA